MPPRTGYPYYRRASDTALRSVIPLHREQQFGRKRRMHTLKALLTAFVAVAVSATAVVAARPETTGMAKGLDRASERAGFTVPVKGPLTGMDEEAATGDAA